MVLQSVVKLFKKNGANPLGGCLPVLIQMPFFIGFFFALREMVELRHSDFVIWTDLSVPDPYFIFPITCYFNDVDSKAKSATSWNGSNTSTSYEVYTCYILCTFRGYASSVGFVYGC